MAKKDTKVNAMEYVAKSGYPEVGHFTEEKDLQKFYKQLDDAMLLEWVKLEGLEYKECLESAAINRMRMAMAILYKHFPRKPAAKKESKYAQYTLEDLVEMASEHDLAIEMCEDERILRMRLIMGLRAYKIIG